MYHYCMENIKQQTDHTPEELAYWSKEFGISDEELQKALKAGESSTEALEKYVRNLNLEPVE